MRLKHGGIDSSEYADEIEILLTGRGSYYLLQRNIINMNDKSFVLYCLRYLYSHNVLYYTNSNKNVNITNAYDTATK